ncbi:sulfotransferase family protein [Glycomyces sp. NPDC048151]|uniref:sulfotransferase family protein n=1 Tax=Glycomyces sp. NPDC048151 TaxID=3364002 RepID=UPI00371777BB
MSGVPASTRLLNTFLTPALASRHSPDSVFSGLIAAASEGFGGPDGDDTVFDDFRVLLGALARTDRFTALGWQTALVDLQIRVENRIRVRRLHRERPAIGREEVRAPVFVAALPRTATALVRGVLAGSAAHRAPLLWEMGCSETAQREDVRHRHFKRTARLYRSVGRLVPRGDAASAMDPEAPNDCSYLLPHGSQHLLRADLPEYRAWLAERDFRPDYAFLKQALQVLQHGRPPARWVIEAPVNLGRFEAIRAVFPDAVIVWIHRDPLAVLGSHCGVVEASWAMHQRQPDPRGIGPVWLAMASKAIERSRRARLTLPRDAIVDVPYEWLAAHPDLWLPRLFERIGTGWTEADAANLGRVAALPEPGRVYEHDLARYGVGPGDVEAAFGDYPRTVQRLAAAR